MPMGIVSDDELLAELNNQKPVIVDKPHKGRSEGDVNVPESLQKIIGETSEIDGRQEALAIAKVFDVSPSSVSAYANGATSTASYDTPKEELANHINDAKTVVAGKARARLLQAINHITNEKLQECKPRDLAGIAKDMSTIIKDMEPDNGRQPGDSVTFVFHAPQFRKEESYQVIDVGE